MKGNIVAKNDILKLDYGDYDDLTKKLVHKLSMVPQIKSVYLMGGWSQPGISDIDLILVTEKSSKQSLSPEKDVSKNALCDNEVEKYLLMHPPFVIPDKIFSDINSIFYCSDLKILYGESCSLDHHGSDFRNIAEIYKLVSVLTHTYPRFFFKESVSFRSFLTFSFSLKHSYRILREFDNAFKSEFIETYIDSITILRRNAVNKLSDNEIDISSYVNEGIFGCKIMFTKLEEIIKEKFEINIFNKNAFFYIKNYRTVLKFLPLNRCDYKVESHGTFDIIELPMLFVPFILFPTNDSTNITKFQRRNIIGIPNIQIQKMLSENLLRIKKTHDLYKVLTQNTNVLNGMSFELNTSMFWENLKFNLFDVQSIKIYLYRKHRLWQIKRYIKNYG